MDSLWSKRRTIRRHLHRSGDSQVARAHAGRAPNCGSCWAAGGAIAPIVRPCWAERVYCAVVPAGRSRSGSTATVRKPRPGPISPFVRSGACRSPFRNDRRQPADERQPPRSAGRAPRGWTTSNRRRWHCKILLRCRPRRRLPGQGSGPPSARARADAGVRVRAPAHAPFARAVLLGLHHALVEVAADDVCQFVELVFKEVVGAGHDLVRDLDAALGLRVATAPRPTWSARRDPCRR